MTGSASLERLSIWAASARCRSKPDSLSRNRCLCRWQLLPKAYYRRTGCSARLPGHSVVGLPTAYWGQWGSWGALGMELPTGACRVITAARDRQANKVRLGTVEQWWKLFWNASSPGKPGYKMGSSYPDCGLFPILKSKHHIFPFTYPMLLQHLIVYLLAWPFLPCCCQAINDVSIRVKWALNQVINCCFCCSC